MTRPRRGLLLAAAVVLVLSLGLPWGSAPDVSGTGFQTAARVTAAAAVVVFVIALCRRRRDLVLCAAAIAVLGTFIGLEDGIGAGRIAHVLAVTLAVAGGVVTAQPVSRPAPPG